MKTPSIGELTYDELEKKAHQLLDAVDIYERFEDEDLYNQQEIPSEVEGYIRELDEEALEEGTSPGIILANEIKEMYFNLDKMVARYREQHRLNEGKDLKELADETREARTATRRASEAGYEYAREGDDNQERYTVPEEMSLARLIRNESNAKLPETEFHK